MADLIPASPMPIFFSSRRRHTSLTCDWSSDVCSSDLDTQRRLAEESKQRLAQRFGRPIATEIGRASCRERAFKKAFTGFSHNTRNKTRDGLISVRNIRALNGRFNTSITHAYSIVIGSKHITLNATGGGFLTASKQFRHGATSKSRSNTASNSTKHKSPHLSGWRQIVSLIT